MKKILAALLAAMMLLTLAACGGNSGTKTVDVQKLADDLKENVPYSAEMIDDAEEELNYKMDPPEGTTMAGYIADGNAYDMIVVGQCASEEDAKTLYANEQTYESALKTEAGRYSPEEVARLDGALLRQTGTLVVLCVSGLGYSGYLNGADNFIDAFANCDAFFGLPWGAIVALVFTVIYFVLRRVISFKDAMSCIPQGFCAMVPAILILTLATSLKNMTTLLGAKEFVAGVMHSASSGLYSLLPAVIYLVACGLAFATGTSWGTFGILIPIVTEVFKADFTLMIVGVSACLAGAVFGDHVSPISDTTIMASAGAQCNHLNHVSTQFPYAATVAIVAFFTYIIAGFVPNAVIVLPIGIVLMLVTLFIIRGITNRRGAEG